MWLMKAKGLMVTSQITKGQLTWSPRSTKSPPGAPLLTLFHPEEGLSLLCISHLKVSSVLSPDIPPCPPPFPRQLNRLWCGACQRLLESVNRVCLLFPPLSIHFFGPSKSSSRLERHNFSLPKTGCLSTGGGVSQVLHNPALRRSADWPGRGTKLVGHFPEALLVPFRSSARRSVSRKGFHFVLPFHKINLIYLGKDTRQNKTHSMLCFPLHGGLRPCYSSEREQEILVRLSVSHFILRCITLFTPLFRLFTGHRLPLNVLVLFRHFFLPSIKNFKGSHCSKK